MQATPIAPGTNTRPVLPDGALLVTNAGKTLRVWNLFEGKQPLEHPAHPSTVTALYWRPDGKTGVFRSKGFCWFLTRSDEGLLWSQAGRYVGLELLGFREAALLADPNANLVPEEREYLRDFLAKRHLVFGDRKSEVTVIGTARDRTISCSNCVPACASK